MPNIYYLFINHYLINNLFIFNFQIFYNNLNFHYQIKGL